MNSVAELVFQIKEDRIRRVSASNEDEKQLGPVTSFAYTENTSLVSMVFLHIYMRIRKAVVSQISRITDASHHPRSNMIV